MKCDLTVLYTMHRKCDCLNAPFRTAWGQLYGVQDLSELVPSSPALCSGGPRLGCEVADLVDKPRRGRKGKGKGKGLARRATVGHRANLE